MEFLKTGIIRLPYESQEIDFAIGIALKIKKSEIDELKTRMLAINNEADVRFLNLQNFDLDLEGNFYHHPECMNIYLYPSGNSKFSYIRALFYLMDKNSEINDFLAWYKTRETVIKDLNAEKARLTLIEDNIRDKITAIKSYEPFSVDNIIKEAKRMKIKGVYDGKLIHFDLGKIKCGDDEEGYIDYQNIIISLTADNELKLSDIHYKFAKWEYRDSWKFCGWGLHPHVLNSSLCAGNREEDFIQYRTHKEYGFLLSAYREALTSYNPSSAYSTVSGIAKILNNINYFYSDKSIGVNATDEEKAKAIYELMISQKKRCSKCNNIYYGFECDTENCVKNPNTKKQCSCCDQDMVWNSALHIILCPTCYICPECGGISKEQYCINKHCKKSPLYEEPCEFCFGIKKVTNGHLYCDNPLCQNSEGYTEEGKELINKPVCMFCGDIDHMVQDFKGEWYCSEYGHNISQYTKYGAPLAPTNAYIIRMRVMKLRLMENKLLDGLGNYMHSIRQADNSLHMYGQRVEDIEPRLYAIATPFQFVNEHYNINETFYNITWRKENEQQNNI